MSSVVSTRKRMADFSGFADKWAIVEETVRCIFRKEMSRNSFQRIHTAVFRLCQDQLGNLVLEQLEEQFRIQVTLILGRIHGSANFAADFLHEWHNFNESIRQISNVLLYFDKNYMYNYHHSSIDQVGERIFCSNTLGNAEVFSALVASVKRSVDVPAAETMIRDLGQELYTVEGCKYFVPCMEQPFVEAKIEKYVALSEEQKQTRSPSQYLQWVQDVVRAERDKCAAAFFYIVLDKLTNALYSSLVLRDPSYIQQILQGPNGLRSMTETWDLSGIATIVQVFCAMKKEKEVVDVIAHVIKDDGDAIMANRIANASPFAAVGSFLQLIAKARQLDEQFPPEDGHAQSPFLRVVRNVLGSNGRFMETLSLYYDSAIRQGKDEAMETVRSNVLTVLQLTPDLEPFEAAFRGHLAARLIHAKPHQVDMECLFIDGLFNIYGTSVVNRFQKMVEDIRSATAAQQRLESDMATKKVAFPLHFDVLVLTSGLWPQYTNIPLSVPQSMDACKTLFHEYYRRRHNGRKLVFQMSLGSVVFQLNHGGKTYHVSAHTHFVNSILALNTDKEVSVAAVTQQSALSREEIVTQFNTLCLTGLAQRSGNDYRFNTQFFSSKPKVKVSVSAQKTASDSGGASAASRRNMDGTRTMSLDATIVKLLKEHQSMDHESLCTSVDNRLHDIFVPTKAEIKVRIEALIEKGFVIRGESSNCYFYCT